MGSGSARSEGGPALPLRYAKGTVTLTLHVQPGAKTTGWAGFHGEGALRLRLAAPPVDGKANRACLRFLAELFGVPENRVQIVRGEHARTKTVAIHQVTPQRWEAFRATWEAG